MMRKSDLLRRTILFCAAASLSLSTLSACSGKISTNDDVNYTPIEKEDGEVYRISLVESREIDTAEKAEKGLRDALDDLFGEKHYTLSLETGRDDLDVGSLVRSQFKLYDRDKDGEKDEGTGPQLLLVCGETATAEAATVDSDLPVVSYGVMDYHDFLDLPSDRWTDPLGGNMTGVSNRPPLADYLSLIIESQPDLTSVGLLYSPNDRSALMQNQILETYMDQASIPWKEYALPVDDTALEKEKRQLRERTAYLAAQGKEDSAVRSEVGMSLRQAKTSPSWSIPVPTDNDPDPLTRAINECSVLVLTGDSDLEDQAGEIASRATAAGVPTVGCSLAQGKYTLTSLYTDPYAVGYEAGKQVYRILIKGEDPKDMAIETVPAKASVKLYQASVASALRVSFPKSFKEVDTFLQDNPPGTTTDRIKDPDELDH